MFKRLSYTTFSSPLYKLQFLLFTIFSFSSEDHQNVFDVACLKHYCNNSIPVQVYIRQLFSFAAEGRYRFAVQSPSRRFPLL